MGAPGHATPCRVCDAAAAPGFALCFCCGVLVRQLGMPLVPLRSVAVCRPGDAVHRRLRSYKDGPVAEVRDANARRLAVMAEGWLATRGSGGSAPFVDGYDVVTTVPSSSRPSGTPVDAVVSGVPRLALFHRPLLVRGHEPTGHLLAARGAFAIGPGVDGDRLRRLRVLVVDDSVVTGARAQSAAAALRLAGARVVGVLALGRIEAEGRSPVRDPPGEAAPAGARPSLLDSRSCSSVSSPSPSRVRPTTTSSQWPDRPSPSGSMPSSAATTT